MVTDSAGAVAETMDYFPFGGIRIDKSAAPAGAAGSPAFSEHKKNIGQEYDKDTGLNYLNARYYNATLARFISQDPMFWNFDATWLADPQSQNSYACARNNPIILSDPTGLDPYAFSRPVGEKFPLNNFAHTGTFIVPGPNENLPSITTGSMCIDTSKPFTLGAFPVGKPITNWHLTFQANNKTDYEYAMAAYEAMKNGQQIPGVAMVKIDPPAGMTGQQLERNIVNTFNSAPTDQGYYNPFGGRRGTGFSNSNNANNYLLTGSGVSQQQMNNIKDELAKSTGRLAPGFGASLNAPTYIESGVQKVLNSSSSSIQTLTKVLDRYNNKK